MNTSLPVRLLGAVLVHAATLGLLWLFFHLRAGDQAALSEPVLQQARGNPDAVRLYLEDIGGALLNAGALALLASLLLAAGWLVIVTASRPAGDRQARSKRGLWAGLLLVGWVATAAIFWFAVLGNAVHESFAPGVAFACLAATLAAVLLAYYASTALFVPRVSRVSVPGASALLG